MPFYSRIMILKINSLPSWPDLVWLPPFPIFFYTEPQPSQVVFFSTGYQAGQNFFPGFLAGQMFFFPNSHRALPKSKMPK
jgi:hypothetical protein